MPSQAEPVFTVSGSPDAPLELFAQGRLGIVLPTYARTYLVVAYRYLSGKPPSKDEETAFLRAWAPDFGQPSPTEAALHNWQEARNVALPRTAYLPHPAVNPYRTVRGGWHEYVNCGNDALLTAANTLNNLSRPSARAARQCAIGCKRRTPFSTTATTRLP